MPRITDAFLVKQRQDGTRPVGVSAAQPQTFLAVSFPTLVEIHLACHVRATRAEFGHAYPLTLDVTDANGFPVQAPVRMVVVLDAAKRTSPERVETELYRCPSYRLILHEAGIYRLVLHMPDSPSFVVPFKLLESDTKSTYEPAHDAASLTAKR